jgi:glucose/arabinose dehydrogenase
MRRFALALALAVAAHAAPFSVAAQPPDLPDHFVIEPVVLDPFDSPPIGFAFLPDGRVLVIEKDAARVRIATAASTASVVIATVPGVTNDLERGLLGVAVDPDWPARPYVYLHSTRAGAAIHISMYTASGDLTDPASTNLALADPYVLVNDIPDLGPTHNGGTLRFGPDGLLYVSLGEDARSCEAQNLAQPLGKVLRLDVAAMPGAGSGPPPKADITPAANPFQGGEWQRLVYAYGLRNPFRFCIDPQTGDLYIGDVGHLTWEEVDRVAYQVPDDANYGWPEFEATLQDPIPSAADCSTPPFTPPIHQYPNPPGAGVASIIGGPLVRTDAWASFGFPRAYDGDLFVADFYGGWIRRLHGAGTTWSLADSVAGQPSRSEWARYLGQIVDLQQGPDGALYVMCFTAPVQRGLYRIRSTLPSAAPDEAAGAVEATWRGRCVPNPAPAGQPVRFALPAGATGVARIRIFDVTGRLLRTLRADAVAGFAHWDGRTHAGHPLAAGTYVFEMRPVGLAASRGKLVVAP